MERELWQRKDAYDRGWIRGNDTRERLSFEGRYEELRKVTEAARSRYISERDPLKRREYMGEYDGLTGRE